MQINDLNDLLRKRDRDMRRARAQLKSITAMPKEGLNLKQLAAQAALATGLQEQVAALSADNEALRRAAQTREFAGLGDRAGRQLQALASAFAVRPGPPFYPAPSSYFSDDDTLDDTFDDNFSTSEFSTSPRSLAARSYSDDSLIFSSSAPVATPKFFTRSKRTPAATSVQDTAQRHVMDDLPTLTPHVPFGSDLSELTSRPRSNASRKPSTASRRPAVSRPTGGARPATSFTKSTRPRLNVSKNHGRRDAPLVASATSPSTDFGPLLPPGYDSQFPLGVSFNHPRRDEGCTPVLAPSVPTPALYGEPSFDDELDLLGFAPHGFSSDDYKDSTESSYDVCRSHPIDFSDSGFDSADDLDIVYS